MFTRAALGLCPLISTNLICFWPEISFRESSTLHFCPHHICLSTPQAELAAAQAAATEASAALARLERRLGVHRGVDEHGMSFTDRRALKIARQVRAGQKGVTDNNPRA